MPDRQSSPQPTVYSRQQSRKPTVDNQQSTAYEKKEVDRKDRLAVAVGCWLGCRLYLFQTAENVKKADKTCEQQIKGPSATVTVAHQNILTICYYVDISRDAKAGNLTKTLFKPALTL